MANPIRIWRQSTTPGNPELTAIRRSNQGPLIRCPPPTLGWPLRRYHTTCIRHDPTTTRRGLTSRMLVAQQIQVGMKPTVCPRSTALARRSRGEFVREVHGRPDRAVEICARDLSGSPLPNVNKIKWGCSSLLILILALARTGTVQCRWRGGSRSGRPGGRPRYDGPCRAARERWPPATNRRTPDPTLARPHRGLRKAHQLARGVDLPRL